MQYQAVSTQIGPPQDNGDGTVSFVVNYTVGIVGELYNFVVQDKCTVKIPNKQVMYSDIQTTIQTAVNSDCQIKYPKY